MAFLPYSTATLLRIISSWIAFERQSQQPVFYSQPLKWSVSFVNIKWDLVNVVPWLKISFEDGCDNWSNDLHGHDMLVWFIWFVGTYNNSAHWMKVSSHFSSTAHTHTLNLSVELILCKYNNKQSTHQYCHILRACTGRLHTANVSTTIISIRTTPRRARRTLFVEWDTW